MKRNTAVIAFVLLAVVASAGPGCGGMGGKTCGSGIKAQLLNVMLNSADNKTFDNALRNHGSVTEDELPCLLDAVESWRASKRKNGARLLVLAGGDRKTVIEAQKKVVLETNDVYVWAKVFDSLVSPRAKAEPEALAAKRHDMIAKALANEDGFVQSVGLKAGALGKYPGIEGELGKRLKSKDAKVLVVALDALPADTAHAELPKLLKMLAEYEAGTNYTDINFKIYAFPSLLLALIRTEDDKAWMAVRTALEKGYTTPDEVRGVREEFRNFRTDAALIKHEEAVDMFCFYLIEEKSVLTPSAIDILTTQVWAGKQEPKAKTVRICVAEIEAGNLDPAHNREHLKDKPGQVSCERFFFFLETGENPLAAGSGMKRKTGSDAAQFGRQWLEENE